MYFKFLMNTYLKLVLFMQEIANSKKQYNFTSSFKPNTKKNYNAKKFL